MDRFYSPFRPSRRTARRRESQITLHLEPLEERRLFSFSLLKDINTVPVTPNQITGAGGKVYFMTTGSDGGAELDVKTAKGVTQLAEDASDLTPLGSKLYFFALAGQDQQLWATDGTRAGTRPVTNVKGGLSAATAPTVVRNKFYFTADVTQNGKENVQLYESNGTSAGTVPVPLPPAFKSKEALAVSFVGFNGSAYFGFGAQLMKTDGAKTTLVTSLAGINSDPVVTGFVRDLTVAGKTLYFSFQDASGNGVDLYATNGTARGTRLLKDFVNPTLVDLYVLSNLTAAGGKLYFGIDDVAHGPSLWVSNGTRAGTKLVKKLPTAPNSGPVVTATPVGRRLFFTTASPDAATGEQELWVSNGTTVGTTALATVNPGTYFGVLGGLLYFANDDPAHGVELWRSDGTAAGTRLFDDLNPGPASSFPANMTTIGNRLYFSATTAPGTGAVWKTDGSLAGTTAIASFNAQPDGSSTLNSGAVLGNKFVVAATDGANGVEIWETDGTSAGTAMVKVVVPGPLGTVSEFTTVGNRAYFVISGTVDTLWVTDGTTAGTVQLATIGGTILDPIAFDGELAFLDAQDGANGTAISLWTSDGTATGTTRVKGFSQADFNTYFAPPMLGSLNGKLYLSAPPPNSAPDDGFTIWTSDGTTAGTKPLPGSPVDANPETVVAGQGKVFFWQASPVILD